MSSFIIRILVCVHCPNSVSEGLSSWAMWQTTVVCHFFSDDKLKKISAINSRSHQQAGKQKIVVLRQVSKVLVKVTATSKAIFLLNVFRVTCKSTCTELSAVAIDTVPGLNCLNAHLVFQLIGRNVYGCSVKSVLYSFLVSVYVRSQTCGYSSLLDVQQFVFQPFAPDLVSNSDASGSNLKPRS